MKHHIYDEETAITASPFGEEFWDKSIAPYFAGITMIVGLLILLTGLLNFFHFLMGTFLNRNREYGIRKVMGSGNQQLFTNSLSSLSSLHSSLSCLRSA